VVHQRRDRLNLVGHPRVDFQNRRTGMLSRAPRLEIRCSVQASHSTHGKRLTLRRNASRGP
jgi:hypothetical protein